MAKCFVAFYNALGGRDKPLIPCFYETFIDGLLKSGNEVLVETTNIWSFKTVKCPPHIAKKIKDFNPDVCFLFNNCFYDISNVVECPIVVYEVDSFLFYKNKTVLYQNPNRFLYFVPQTCSFDVLQKELHVDKNKICYVPFFTEVQATKEPLLNNICFVGSKFTDSDKSLIHKFMLLNPTFEEKEQLKQVFSIVSKNPNITIPELEKQIGPVCDKCKSMLKDPYLVVFLSDVRRIKVLSAVADLGLTLYGTKNWTNDLPYNDLVLSYTPETVCSLSDTQKVYNSHKIGINVNNIQAATGFGWRVADIMASNACLVSEYRPDFTTLFPDIPIPFFDNPNEATAICNKLLKNKNMRQDIVAQCQAIIDKKYRFKHTLQIMEQFLGIQLRNKNHIDQAQYMPPINDKGPSVLKRRTKQIIYSLLLLVISLPVLHLVFDNKLQQKLKKKVNSYF